MDDDDENEITPLDFLEAVYPQSKPSAEYADGAAIEAAPYKHPKQSAVAIAHYGPNCADALEKAIERSRNPPPMLSAPKVIEHEQLVSASEMKKPFARNRRY